VAIPIGFSGVLYQGGTSTTLTNAATTNTATAPAYVYQITAAANRVLDPTVAIVVKENGVVSTHVANVNAMNGSVTFNTSYTPTAPVTISGNYIPTAAVGAVAEMDFSPKLNTTETTPLNSAGYVQRFPTTFDADGSFKYYGNLTDDSLQTIITGRTPMLIVQDPAGTGAAVHRIWAVLTAASLALKPKDVNVADVKFSLYDQSYGATNLSGFPVNAAFAFYTT